jgi:Opacity protein and related surface antigens
MKFKILTSVAVASMAITPAVAQDDQSFSGLSLAVLGGYDSVRLSDGTDSSSKDNVMYGVSIGYNADLGSAVVGIEAEIADSEVEDSVTDLLTAGDSLSLAAARDLYVGVRAGARIGPDVLAYVKGGYTNARLKATYDDGVDVLSDGDNLDGFRLGAGLEYSFGRFGLRGEYRYSDYGEYSYANVNTGISAQRHQVAVGIVGKF